MVVGKARKIVCNDNRPFKRAASEPRRVCVICLDGRALQVLLLGTIGMQVMRQCLRVDLVIMVALVVGCVCEWEVGQESLCWQSQLNFNVVNVSSQTITRSVAVRPQ